MKIKLEELTLKDVIETLVTYNYELCRFPHNYMAERGFDVPEVKGLAIDDKKLILIDREQSIEDMRETIIHEFLHTKHYRQGDLKIKEIERIIEKETKLTYEKLYDKRK